MTVHDINQASRRSLLYGAVSSLLDTERRIAERMPVEGTDAAFLSLLLERAGDVAAAVNRGHTDLDGELLKLAATVLAWADRLGEERAR